MDRNDCIWLAAGGTTSGGTPHSYTSVSPAFHYICFMLGLDRADVWLYNTTSAVWKWVAGSSTATDIERGTLRLYNDASSFGTRFGTSLAIDGENNLLLIGGTPSSTVWSIPMCLPGTYKLETSSTCAPCIAGYYCPNGAEQLQCTNGTYCPSGMIAPLSCSNNTQSSPGSSDITNCTCVPGTRHHPFIHSPRFGAIDDQIS